MTANNYNSQKLNSSFKTKLQILLGHNKYFLFGFLLVIAILQVFYIHYKKTIKELWHPIMTPLFLTMVFGFWLNLIGKKIPNLNQLGLGFLLCILVPSFLVQKEIIPKILADAINKDFFNKSNHQSLGINFSQFFVTIATIGSILNIDKNLLKKALWKFIPLTLIALFCSFLLVGLVGVCLEYDAIPQEFIKKNYFSDSIIYLCNSLTSGGTNLGINRFANDIFPPVFKIDSKQIRSMLVAPLILTRILAILFGGILYKIFDKTTYSGGGKLEIKTANNTPITKDSDYKKNAYQNYHQQIGTSLLIIFALYNGATIINKFLSNYGFAMDGMIYLIITLIIIKIFNLMSNHYEKSIIQSSKFIITNFTPAALVCFSISTDFDKLIKCIMNYKIFIMIVVSLLSVVLITFILAKSFGFCPLEAALTAGLCSHSVGGMGNIGIMSISHRMNLLPFANIATRIVGPIIFVMMNIFFKLYYY
ncbi:2-hydroxycarboxylate transporter family protein [Candidatus Phytoplasma solani]|uniref:2-hydroxycarboxylate transporter family protein n=1 Tax=Candidatus Phytoplasma solani TaxID=69896 RepID=UPI0003B7DFBA|nr:2-hydroxycarboxylate transporter family protein [Candidatus Phytoplasma solani]CCP88272.1 Malate/Na+ symporter [Candidatus Phytoplasma solani]CCP88768.1 Na+/citrate-malate symporter [Candidatus Phytoplasma solani]